MVAKISKFLYFCLPDKKCPLQQVPLVYYAMAFKKAVGKTNMPL